MAQALACLLFPSDRNKMEQLAAKKSVFRTWAMESPISLRSRAISAGINVRTGFVQQRAGRAHRG
jgi:hypothetical protein